MATFLLVTLYGIGCIHFRKVIIVHPLTTNLILGIWSFSKLDLPPPSCHLPWMYFSERIDMFFSLLLVLLPCKDNIVCVLFPGLQPNQVLHKWGIHFVHCGESCPTDMPFLEGQWNQVEQQLSHRYYLNT